MSLPDLLARPEALLLPAGPAAWFALRALDRARARRLGRVAGPRAPALAPEFTGVRRAARRALSAAGILLASAALLGPARGDPGAAGTAGADVVVCLDVSRSMLARDVRPDRLSRAKDEIRRLAERARGDRLGLVAFAGEARLLVPLTGDLGTFAEIAGSADPLAVGRGGTDLGAALERALAALDAGRGAAAAILLVTDGEDLGGRGLRAAEKCRERGVAVHCLGLGTPRGGKIASEDPAAGGFQRDASGREVVSRMDPASLRALAAAGGGDFVDGSGREGALADLLERRLPRRAGTGSAGEGEGGTVPAIPWLLLAAFFLWSVELCLTDRRPS